MTRSPALAAALAMGLILGCSTPGAAVQTVSTTNSGQIDTPDDFDNIFVTCDGTTRLYLTETDVESSSAITAVPNSPECPTP